MSSLNGSVDSFKQITRNFLMFLSYAHCTAATAFLVYLQSLDYCFHFFSHDTENTCYAVWLTSEKMWLSILQICNCWNKKMCMSILCMYICSTLKSNPLQILLIFSRDLFLQQCKGAPVTNARLRGKPFDYLTKTNVPTLIKIF